MPHLVPPASINTLIKLLHYRAVQHPQQRAYTFLVDGETEAIHLTYQDLETQALTIAIHLQPYCTLGARVLLLYPPGLDYIAAFFGCLYAGAIAVPAYPPRPNRSLERLQAIVADCQATAVLTTQALLTSLEHRMAHIPGLNTLHWITTEATQSQPPTDRLSGLQITQARRDALQPDHLAFLQYTSGSTATPKGVMISHRNILANLQALQSCFEISNESIGVFWLPLYHDMGLVGGILQPLYCGRPVILMSPLMFIQRPIRWLAAISRFQATISGGPNFAYDLCVQKITPAQQDTLDLSQWSLAFNGAEPINAKTLQTFAAKFAPCGFQLEAFYPCYGMAETTLIATGGRKTAPPTCKTIGATALAQGHVQPVTAADAPTQTIVGCGISTVGQQLMIVDPKTCQPCPAHTVGEIWITGPSVAQGYWQQPDLTQRTFAAQLKNQNCLKFLRTGDLGFVSQEEVFVTGRLKDILIMHGRNYYPQDLEWTLERTYGELQTGGVAAFCVQNDGRDHIIIFAEVDRKTWRKIQAPETMAQRIADIKRSIWQHHEVNIAEVVLLKPGSIPKTSSGKVQRHRCRQMYLEKQI